MSDYQLSNEDYEALGKFTKFFLVKAAQIIVQSRLGEKKTTKSKPVYSGNEWFHLSIKDIPEVTVNAKKCLGDAQHLLIDSPHSPFCVEISLRTPDCDTITLETWCISFDDSVSDPAQRVRFNIYNRMSIVLRSLLACTRATPTYQLSRKQSADKYIICYKMYTGEPIVSHLGEHYSKKTIGSIVTPIGRFVLNVAYRTRLTMSSPQIENGMNAMTTQFGIDIKTDHFSLDKTQRSVEDDNDAQLPSEHNSSVPKSSPIEVMKRRHASCDSVSSSHGTPDKVFYSKLRAAFATPGTTTYPSNVGSYSRTNDNDLPFVLMMQQHQQQQHSMDHDHQQEHNVKSNFYASGDSENETAPDDFILVEVKPFFGKSDSTDDLALFIRSCQQPPMLESFIVEPSLSETINQLNEELRIFESKVEEFDQLVEPITVADDDQFFDCLNDDETHEQNTDQNPPIISHYYAVWIPSDVETTENQFVFNDMKSAFILCKKYSKHNSRVKIFANRDDAENFIQQTRNNSTNNIDLNMSIEQTSKPVTNDVEKLPYSDVPTSELTKLYNLAEKGDENEFERLIWTNPRYLISSGDSPTIVKISVRYNSMHVAALSGQSGIIRLLIKTIKNVHFIRRLYVNDTEEQTQQRIQFILDMYVNTPDKMQNETPLHLASKFGHYDAVSALLDEPSCSRDAINKAGSIARDIVCSRAKEKSKEKKIRQLFESTYYIPIYSRKITMEKIISKPIDETAFKLFLNTIQQASTNLPIECDNEMILIAFAGPTTYDLAMKFYTSVNSSTRGQARRAQSFLSSPKSPIYIVRSDAEKGWERVARSYALETYSINWCEYWPFLNTYINLSSTDGLRLLEYYLQQRILHSQILKTIDQFEKFSSHYLSTEKKETSNEHDAILNSISQLIQSFYSLIDLFDLNDFILNRNYRHYLEVSGFENQQNNDLQLIKTNIIHQLQWLSTENKTILPLFTRPLLNSLTMVFTLIISPSGCALIDKIQQNQYELHRYQQKVRPASRLSLIGLVCPKRRQSRRSHKSSREQLIRSNSWPNLSSASDSSIIRRYHSHTELNQNNNNYLSSSSSSGLLNETMRKSIQDLTQRSLSISSTPTMFSSQTSVDISKEDKAKIDKWHYFLAGSQPTKLDAHVVRAIDLSNSNNLTNQPYYRLWPKWYQAVQMRPIEEQNLWTTPIRNSSPSNRKVRIEYARYRRSLIIDSP
ncbi:hypothetical protein I4U23_028244 [Adineta vaga]|nr:hypothetical protein I4U23_028244 [Adineta vaga]